MAITSPGGTPPIFGGGDGGHGYQGLDSIFQILQGGVNQNQYNNMAAGATGANGMGIGGMHGAFGGLSPYAVHFLATSGLLSKVAAPTTGPDGQPLTGSSLLMANLTHQLGGDQYKLADGITEDNLQQLFGMGFGGHSAYAKGFNADGGGQLGGGHPPIFHPPHPQHPQGGPGHRVGMGGGHGPIQFPVRHPNQGHGGQLPFRTLNGPDGPDGRRQGRGRMVTNGPGHRIGRKPGRGPIHAPGR